MSPAGSTGRSEAGQRPPVARIAVIGLLSAGVVVALYVAGRVHAVNPAFSLFGRQYFAAVPPAQVAEQHAEPAAIENPRVGGMHETAITGRRPPGRSENQELQFFRTGRAAPCRYR